MDVTFSPSVLASEPGETGFSKVRITTHNARSGSQIIPLTAIVNFTSEVQFNLLGRSKNYSNPVISNIPLNTNLTISIKPIPPFYQPILEFSKNVIEPFSVLITATIIPLVTAAAGLMVYLKKRRSQSQESAHGKDTNKGSDN